MSDKTAQEQELNELENLDVLSVGLVPQGANQEEFFLLKEDEAAEELEELAERPPEGTDESAWAKLLNIVAQAVSGGPDEVEKALDAKAQRALKMALRVLSNVREQLPPEGKKAVATLAQLAGYGSGKYGYGEGKYGYGEGKGKYGYGYPQPAKKEDAVAKSDEPAEETPIPEPVREQLALLEKSRQELAERLEKAEQELEAERERRRLEAYVEKARALSAVPVQAEELGEQLAWLAKQDEEREAWWSKLLEALNRQVLDAGLFQEIGTQAPPPEPLAKALEKARSGKMSLREALLTLPPEVQESYLRDQRRAAKEV